MPTGVCHGCSHRRQLFGDRCARCLSTSRHGNVERSRFTWSRPHHGVQHLSGNRALDGGGGLRRTHQITVEDRGSFSDVSVLHLTSAHPFTAVAEETFRGNGHAERARAWGVAQAKMLDGSHGDVRRSASTGDKHWVVVARVVTEMEPMPRKTWRDPYTPRLQEVPVARGAVWRKGVPETKLAAEVAKATQSVGNEGYRVFVYPSSERDPIGRAKREMLQAPTA
jgi:hypothetical protein